MVVDVWVGVEEVIVVIVVEIVFEEIGENGFLICFDVIELSIDVCFEIWVFG